MHILTFPIMWNLRKAPALKQERCDLWSEALI